MQNKSWKFAITMGLCWALLVAAVVFSATGHVQRLMHTDPSAQSSAPRYTVEHGRLPNIVQHSPQGDQELFPKREHTDATGDLDTQEIHIDTPKNDVSLSDTKPDTKADANGGPAKPKPKPAKAKHSHTGGHSGGHSPPSHGPSPSPDNPTSHPFASPASAAFGAFA
jgi:hypothetical protein